MSREEQRTCYHSTILPNFRNFFCYVIHHFLFCLIEINNTTFVPNNCNCEPPTYGGTFFFNKPNSYIQAFSCCYLQSYNFLLFIFRDISISFLLCCRDGIGTPALCIPSSTIKGYSYVKSMSFQGM